MTGKHWILSLIVMFIAQISTAQSWSKAGEIEADAIQDRFGSAVAINADGYIIAVGAPNHNSLEYDSGITRIYQRVSGNWLQKGEDINGDSEYSSCGCSVSLSDNGNIVAIGEQGFNGKGYQSGRVRIFKYEGGAWVQLGNDILGDHAEDNLGCSVSISSDGKTIATGARGFGLNGINSGLVRVFEDNGGEWVQKGSDILGNEKMEYFGWAIDLSGDASVLVCGSPRANPVSTFNYSGGVRVYSYESDDWSQIGDEIIGVENEDFGQSVNINYDGTIIAAGGPAYHDGTSYTGRVMVFANHSGILTQLGNDIYGEAQYSDFGYSVTLSHDGTIMAVGAPYDQQAGYYAGMAYIYQYQNGGWSLLADGIGGEEEWDHFGHSVSLAGNGLSLVTGVPFREVEERPIGCVRIYDSYLVSVEDLIDEQLTVYPNPATKQLKIDLSDIMGRDNTDVIISIADLKGNLLLRQKAIAEQEILDVSKLAGGIYTLSILCGEHVYVSKFVKE